MKILGIAIFEAPANTEDVYNLLLAVLPSFMALGVKISGADDRSSETIAFYNCFTAEVENLRAALSTWDPTEMMSGLPEEEEEVNTTLVTVLDELEKRFLSWKGKAAECRRLKLERRQGESHPKLRALRRILPEDDNLDSDFVSALAALLCIDSKDSNKQAKLLWHLKQAFCFFENLRPSSESNSVCPMRFSDYPFKHMRKMSETLFEVLKTNWSCQCTNNPSHAKRKTRLSLTQNQRFEMAPNQGRIPSNKMAFFRVLFPTRSQTLEWQDTEITVKNGDHESDYHEKVENGLCGVMEVSRGVRPRMVIFSKNLWQLRSDPDINPCQPPRLGDAEFKSLKELLKPNRSSRKSSLSSMDKKDRLILSFVLATSLLHFFEVPWLQTGLNNENICFLTSNPRSLPDITKPYFTTSCTFPHSRPEPRKLNQPHRFPDILSLGILLLEIARGDSIDFGEAEDRCVTTLKCFDEWRKFQPNTLRDFPDEFYQAVQACIEPKEYRKFGLDKTSVGTLQARTYIFERILFPLEESLSTVYEIQSSTLHTYISGDREISGTRSFDDEHQHDNHYQLAIAWSRYLSNVHNMVDDCIERYRNLSQDEEATHVKIAVLDTGLRLPENLQENYIKAGRISINESESFLSTEYGATDQEWRVDLDGHGSRVGQIILEVAPTAVLHVARVFKSRKDLANVNMATHVHERIAEAINRATNEWKVDMVVMCFGFDRPIPLIQDAMEKASRAEKAPLFFAATRNDGANQRMAWPARDCSVIGISSTAGDGNPSSFNPPEEDFHPIFYAFGEGVSLPLARLDMAQRNGIKYVSGTSYATPVAVGLAANLLGCVRMMVETCSREDQHKYERVPSRMQSMSGMLAVLKAHMRKKHCYGTKSLLPWDFLEPSQLDDNKLLEKVWETLQEC